VALTTAGILAKVKNRVYSLPATERPFETTLSTASINGTATTVDVPDGDAWAVNDVGEFDDGDQFLVTAVAVNALTVVRSYGDTTGASHTQGDRITKNPNWSVEQMTQILQDVVDELAPDIYYIYEGSLTYTPDDTWYEVASADLIIEPMNMYYKDSGKDDPQPIDYWRWESDVDDTAWSENKGFAIPASLSVASGASIYYTAKKRFADVTTMPDRYSGMLVAGVVYNLLGGSEVARSIDPGKRTDRTVQPGQHGRNSVWFYREFIRLRERHAADLWKQERFWPTSRVAARSRRYRA
jgi:hypothetical protein